MGRLDDLDLSKKLSKKEEAAGLEAGWLRLTQLRLTLGGQIGDRELGPPVCVVFEGWDASGKGGAIKRLVAQIDPRHVRVVQFAVPTHDEKRHHFLWRFWPVLPGWGGMTVLDRSWYGRVLVERVEGFADREAWMRAYDEINSFERTLADEGMILVKVWMHISDAEQLKRFEENPAEYRPGGTPRVVLEPVYLDKALAKEFLDHSRDVKKNSSTWVKKQRDYLAWWTEHLAGLNLRKLSLLDHIKPPLQTVRATEHRIATFKALFGYLRKVKHLMSAAEDNILAPAAD